MNARIHGEQIAHGPKDLSPRTFPWIHTRGADILNHHTVSEVGTADGGRDGYGIAGLTPRSDRLKTIGAQARYAALGTACICQMVVPLVAGSSSARSISAVYDAGRRNCLVPG